MCISTTVKENSLQNNSVTGMTNNIVKKNTNSAEKWVYFAVARKWRKVESGLFTK